MVNIFVKIKLILKVNTYIYHGYGSMFRNNFHVLDYLRFPHVQNLLLN